MKEFPTWCKKALLNLIKFYGKGLIETISIAAIITVFALIVNAAQPINTFFGLFLPEKALFPAMGIIFLFVIAPFLLSLMEKLGAKKILAKVFRKIPLLNLIFREDEKTFQEGIPVAVRLFNNVIAYGFLRGKSKVEDKTGFVKSDWLLCVFLPSAPIPFTSMLAMDFEPEDVRIVVINGKEKNNEAIAAIIQNRCLRFGKPLASIVRFKELKEKEIKKLPLLSKEDKK